MTKYLEIQLRNVAPKAENQNPIFSFLKAAEAISNSIPVLSAKDFHLLKNGSEKTICKSRTHTFGKINKLKIIKKHNNNLIPKPVQKINSTLLDAAK